MLEVSGSLGLRAPFSWRELGPEALQYDGSFAIAMEMESPDSRS